jgi:hypothetical protein
VPLEELMSVLEERDIIDGTKCDESWEVESNVVRDLVIAVSDKDMNCEVKLEVSEGA